MLKVPLQSTVWQGQVTAGDDYKHDLARNIREDNSRHFKMKALTSEILVQEAFRETNSSMSSIQTASRSCFLQAVLCHSGGDGIYEMRCLFVAVGANALFIVLPHWGNLS